MSTGNGQKSKLKYDDQNYEMDSLSIGHASRKTHKTSRTPAIIIDLEGEY